MSLLVDTRAIAWITGLGVVGVIAVLVTLGTGALPATPWQVVQTLTGTADAGQTFIVRDLGLSRAVTGACVGAGLGIAGALMQALTRNPLGSPDVIGFDSGATLGALVGIIVLGLAQPQYSLLAVVVGLLAAGAVYLLSSGGTDSGYRIVLIGIGIGAMLDSANAYLLTRSDATESLRAVRWLLGSLNDSSWTTAALAAMALLLAGPPSLVVARHLRAATLGVDVATSLGVRGRSVGAATVLLAVVLSVVAVLAAGPISFVALAAPQLALRVVGGRGAPRVVASAVMGALLLVVSDLVAQRALPDHDLPVGVVTGAVGGIYLAWLLTKEWRKRAP